MLRAGPLDPKLYPRTYRIRASRRRQLFAISVLSIVVGSSFLTVCALDSKGIPWGMALLWFLLLAYGVLSALRTIRLKVVLTAEELSLYGLGPTRRIRRDEIRGCRTLARHGAARLAVVASARGVRELAIPETIDMDAAFRAWFADLPDLDLESAAIASNLQLEPDAVARIASQQLQRSRVRRREIALATLTMMCSVWFLVYPRPYGLTFGLVVLLPWALPLTWAISPASIDFAARVAKGDHADTVLSWMVVLPSAALALRAARIELLDWRTPLALAAVISSAFAVVTAIVEPSARGWLTMCALILLNLGYGYGVVVCANRYFDAHPSQVFEAKVLGKRERHASKHTSYTLTLGEWGPYHEVQSHNVSARLFERVSEGDTLIARIHAGALGFAWLEFTEESAERRN